ncbi:MAG: hypothetical protein ACREFY_20545, partial [Acetobacteraceae bacterium]
ITPGGGCAGQDMDGGSGGGGGALKLAGGFGFDMHSGSTECHIMALDRPNANHVGSEGGPRSGKGERAADMPVRQTGGEANGGSRPGRKAGGGGEAGRDVNQIGT